MSEPWISSVRMKNCRAQLQSMPLPRQQSLCRHQASLCGLTSASRGVAGLQSGQATTNDISCLLTHEQQLTISVPGLLKFGWKGNLQ